jgi:hypothetical protein
MGIEGEKRQDEGIENILNRTVLENFPNFGKESYPGTGEIHNTK